MDTNTLEKIIEDGCNSEDKVEIPQEDLHKFRYALTEALIVRDCPRNCAIKIARGVEVSIICLKEHVHRVQDDSFLSVVCVDAACMILSRVNDFFNEGIEDPDELTNKVIQTVSIVLQEATDEEQQKMTEALDADRS